MKVRSVWPLLACLAWGLVCAGGVLALWRYELAPGADAANCPSRRAANANPLRSSCDCTCTL